MPTSYAFGLLPADAVGKMVTDSAYQKCLLPAEGRRHLGPPNAYCLLPADAAGI